MATEYIYLSGKGKWIRPNAPDPWGNWKMDLYPNEDSHNKILDLKTSQDGVSGIKNEVKKDPVDGYFITLRRPTQKVYKGKVQGFAPPIVLDKAGQPLRDTPIGNGSDVTVKVAVYTHGTPGGGKAKALRWEALRVDNLVPFEPKKDFAEDQEKQVRGLDEQPEQLF